MSGAGAVAQWNADFLADPRNIAWPSGLGRIWRDGGRTYPIFNAFLTTYRNERPENGENPPFDSGNLFVVP